MGVYVDPLFGTSPTRKWPYKQACHLTADTLDELHAFAQSLGLKRVWFQNHHPNPRLWHYDLTANKRRQAVRAGATPVTRWQFAERVVLRMAQERLNNKHQERAESKKGHTP